MLAASLARPAGVRPIFRGDAEQAAKGVAGDVFDVHIGSKQQDGVVWQ